MPRKFDDKRRNRDLLKKYGITLEEYNKMLAEQDGACKICGSHPTGRPLHVDHWHALLYWKLRSTRTDDGWLVESNDEVNLMPLKISVRAKKKTDALKEARRQLLRLSIRGLICWRDNSALRWGKDDPVILRSAAKYLEDYHAKLRGING